MENSGTRSAKTQDSLALDVAEARKRLGEKRYWLIKEWVREVNGAFDTLIAPLINGQSLVLDAGCSRGDPDLPSLDKAALWVGCDVDLAGLRGNILADAKAYSYLNHLPFRDGSFDVVVCKFVVEHLEDPMAVFKEFARILKPGGHVAVLTPNAHSFFTVISRAIPYKLKQMVKSKLFGGYEEDTFRAWYKSNVDKTLDQMMARAGLRTRSLDMLGGMWIFFGSNKTLALTVRAVERLQMKTPVLRRCATYIMGSWQKA